MTTVENTPVVSSSNPVPQPTDVVAALRRALRVATSEPGFAARLYEMRQVLAAR